MNKLSFIIFLGINFFLFSCFGYAQKREYVIIDKAYSAPVRSLPNSKDTLSILTSGSKVEIFDKKDMRSGSITVTWYKVKIDNRYGWISQYVTMGDIIAEDVAHRIKDVRRMLGADEVRYSKFDETAKLNFKRWALNNTAVQWLKYKNDGLIWVKLNSAKYTSKTNVKKIAEQLSRYYRLQTNYDKSIVVIVWDLSGNEIWAEVELP